MGAIVATTNREGFRALIRAVCSEHIDIVLTEAIDLFPDGKVKRGMLGSTLGRLRS